MRFCAAQIEDYDEKMEYCGGVIVGNMAANTEQRQVVCQDGTISYLLIRKSVKNVNLRIRPDGSVVVSANRRVPISFIEGFIEQKQNYILSALAKYDDIRHEEKQKHMQDIPKKYVSGETYRLLGRSIELKVAEAAQEAVYTDGVFIFLQVKDKDNFRRKEIVMTKWLKEYRIEVFRKLIDERYALLEKYGVPYPELKVRRMTSCWGVCRPKTGVVTLNSRLIEAPVPCIEYVVLHEMAHFLYPNHSKQFWNFVTAMMPDWKERKKILEKGAYHNVP